MQNIVDPDAEYSGQDDHKRLLKTTPNKHIKRNNYEKV